ncbi:hypothetical protein PR003_g4231 [Phytophthora rubi]|uniref:Uncharacterized protein n=1 Tax=Phytophthora rubi TaxID=129364 RepID=A0A6A4FVL4_9STRA|nr:hypothetical protein PR002_g4281 [Phytophthora rubi]KAE9048266.1 hypothetical protein PR001_g3885 [Phytophthora rubi]KAE9352741.1 hypothetical protein PR003_g4231 [Phytophthora rubi]
MDLSVNRASRANSVAVLLYSLGCSVQLTTATASAVRRSFQNVPLSGFARGGRRVVCCCSTPLLPPMTCTGPHPVPQSSQEAEMCRLQSSHLIPAIPPAVDVLRGVRPRHHVYTDNCCATNICRR